jgi:large subunit ribosomal protein L23
MKHAGIIRRIQTTEKGTALAERNQFLIEVTPAANKLEIRRAVELHFGVHVLAVNTLTRRGGTRVLRNRRTTRDPDWKRAIVTLRPGERIEAV